MQEVVRSECILIDHAGWYTVEVSDPISMLVSIDIHKNSSNGIAGIISSQIFNKEQYPHGTIWADLVFCIQRALQIMLGFFSSVKKRYYVTWINCFFCGFSNLFPITSSQAIFKITDFILNRVESTKMNRQLFISSKGAKNSCSKCSNGNIFWFSL